MKHYFQVNSSSTSSYVKPLIEVTSLDIDADMLAGNSATLDNRKGHGTDPLDEEAPAKGNSLWSDFSGGSSVSSLWKD